MPLGFLLQPEADQGVPGPSGPEGADYVGAAARAVEGADRAAGAEARSVGLEAAHGRGAHCAGGARERLSGRRTRPGIWCTVVEFGPLF